MAITIRTTDEHDEMLTQLKELTGKNTTSQALLKGAQIAIEQTELARKQKQIIWELESKVYRIERKVSAFNEALGDLMNLNTNDDEDDE